MWRVDVYGDGNEDADDHEAFGIGLTFETDGDLGIGHQDGTNTDVRLDEWDAIESIEYVPVTYDNAENADLEAV